jgi:hypothetical protein
MLPASRTLFTKYELSRSYIEWVTKGTLAVRAGPGGYEFTVALTVPDGTCYTESYTATYLLGPSACGPVKAQRLVHRPCFYVDEFVFKVLEGARK